MINLRCPKCNDVMPVPESAAGGKETCPSCGNICLVPALQGQGFNITNVLGSGQVAQNGSQISVPQTSVTGLSEKSNVSGVAVPTLISAISLVALSAWLLIMAGWGMFGLGEYLYDSHSLTPIGVGSVIFLTIIALLSFGTVWCCVNQFRIYKRLYDKELMVSKESVRYITILSMIFGGLVSVVCGIVTLVNLPSTDINNGKTKLPKNRTDVWLITVFVSLFVALILLGLLVSVIHSAAYSSGYFKDENTNLIAENKNLTDENSKLNEKIQRAESARDANRAVIERLNGELEKTKTAYIALDEKAKNLDSIDRAYTTLKAENEKLKAENEKLKAENKPIKEEISKTPETETQPEPKVDEEAAQKAQAEADKLEKARASTQPGYLPDDLRTFLEAGRPRVSKEGLKEGNIGIIDKVIILKVDSVGIRVGVDQIFHRQHLDLVELGAFLVEPYTVRTHPRIPDIRTLDVGVTGVIHWRQQRLIAR